MPGINANTKLMFHIEGTNGQISLSDDSGQGHLGTCFLNGTIDSSQFKFGSTSFHGIAAGASTGTESHIKTDSSLDFGFGTSTFQIDYWIRFGTIQGLRGGFRGADGGYGILHRFDTDGKAHLYLSSDTSFTNITNATAGTSEFLVDTWYHEALSWDGSTYRFFVNGNIDVSVSSSTGVYGTAQSLFISTWDNNNYGHKGWVDEFRIQKGGTVWTSAFTPPTAPYDNLPEPITGFSSYRSLLGVGR